MLRQYVRAIRFRECTLMLGFPLMGLFAARPGFHWLASLHFLTFLFGTFLLSASVYSFNSWGGLLHDRLNLRHRGHPLVRGTIPPGSALALSGGLLAGSLLVYAIAFPGLVVIALALKANWILYSNPRRPGKAVPLGGTVLHLFGGTLQALLGYAAVAGSISRGLPWAFYFALLFTAGHFFHEVLDCAADRQAGLSTTATLLGPATGQKLSALTFALSYLYLLGLAISGIARLDQALPFLLAVVPHAWSLSRAGFSAEGAVLVRYQTRYRAVYSLAGVLLAMLPLLG
jgi:4-hydroxybenzoate polyprenyltransferase